MESKGLRAVLGEKSANIEENSTLNKSARIGARYDEKLRKSDQENEGTIFPIAVEPNQTKTATSKELGPEEIDRLQREKAMKVLGFKEWKPASESKASPLASDVSAEYSTLLRKPDLPPALTSEEMNPWQTIWHASGRTHAESDLRAILARMGGKEMVERFDKRVEQLTSRIAGGEVLPVKEWSSLLTEKKLTVATKTEYVSQMGDSAALASDIVVSTIRDGKAVRGLFSDRYYSLRHFQYCPNQPPKETRQNIDSLLDVTFWPEIYSLEGGYDQALESTIDIFKKCSSRLFATSLTFHGERSAGDNEFVLVMVDSEVVVTYRRQNFWSGAGLIEACCLYQTLRCATPYELGFSPFILDSAMLSSKVQLDFGRLSRLSSIGTSTSTLLGSSDLITLQTTPISFPVSDPFIRATLVYRYEQQVGSPAIVLKISRQENFSKEQSVNARLHGTPTSPLPAHLGTSTDYFPSFEFGLSLDRLSCQIDQSALDSLNLEKRVGSRSMIIPRHLEILITSTPTEGILFSDAVRQGKTTPVDLFNTIITVIDAIEFAFHQGVMHCDISPGNILFCPADKTARLFDFDCAEIVGEVQKTTPGTTMTMSINRLQSRQNRKVDPPDSRRNHSPLDDVESTVYYFFHILASILDRALSVNVNSVFPMGIAAKLEAWAVEWEKCKWEANESEVKEDEGVQAARANIWNFDEATIELATRYCQKQPYLRKFSKFFETRSTSSCRPDLTVIPKILRDINTHLVRRGLEITRHYGLTSNSNSKYLSDSTLQSYRNGLWDSQYLMKVITDWIYTVAGEEEANGLLEALEGISQWRDEEEFHDLWDHHRYWWNTAERQGIEAHAARIERKCAELRVIFIKLKGSANPFLERIWTTDIPKM